MEKRIAFLGCGKIGKTMLHHVLDHGRASVTFIQDPFFQPEEGLSIPVSRSIKTPTW